MSNESQPFAEKKFLEIKGRRMAYIDEGEGSPIVFLHGTPTSSYLWRNVMRACRGLGRLIACDNIGMGDSDKVLNSGTDSYSYSEHREYMFGLFDKLNLGKKIIFVVHDWGAWLALEWTRHNSDRVQGIAYVESILITRTWSEVPAEAQKTFQYLRSSDGEKMILEDNSFVEQFLKTLVMRELSAAEITQYLKPYLMEGEDRRPTLSAIRQLPIEGEPVEIANMLAENASWLTNSPLPKLYIHTEPGALDQGRQREFCRSLPNQTEATVKGIHFVQEDSPIEIGAAVEDFVRGLRFRRSEVVPINVPVLVVDGVVKLPPEANGAIIIGGSNATIYAAYFSAKAGARAAIHHDCGIGRDEAGVSGLPWAEQHGMAMAAVATDSARAGDAADMLHRGIISRVNKVAATCGVETGQTVAQAVELLKSAPWPHADVEAPVEKRAFVGDILCIGSISFATPEDAGLVVASGSHGGVSAAPFTRSFKPRLVFFNDAGFGADRAGAACLPLLDSDGIAAATVAADSACIGDGESTLTQGIISAVNETAYRLGARVGAMALDVARIVERR
ncbi:MAG: haloalkane dehalogenase [Candidatus Obscuribacterales bacterium]|nr:haloalkane dehalogenase [Candidatus Obscuribacterales bacterium]